MKIILRKKDSVTSNVLFIFNIYGEYAGRYSISLSSIIDFMQQFDKNETSTRMGLSRMVRAGVLENNKVNGQVFYNLTGYGLENINIWNEGISRFFDRYKKRNQGWNGKWYSLVLLDFNRSDKDSRAIMDDLAEMGLRELSNNNWISPYQFSIEVKEMAVRNRVKYLELSGGDLCLNFSFHELLEDVFGIEIVRKGYLKLLNVIQDTERKIQDVNPGDGCSLPMLFKLGWNFYDIAVSDPALPKEIIDKWEGDRAVARFRTMRTDLYQRVTEYFKKNCI